MTPKEINDWLNARGQAMDNDTALGVTLAIGYLENATSGEVVDPSAIAEAATGWFRYGINADHIVIAHELYPDGISLLANGTVDRTGGSLLARATQYWLSRRPRTWEWGENYKDGEFINKVVAIAP